MTMFDLEALLQENWQPPDLALAEFARQPPPPSFWETERRGVGQVFTCRSCLRLGDESFTVRFTRRPVGDGWRFGSIWVVGVPGGCLDLAALGAEQLGPLCDVVAALGCHS